MVELQQTDSNSYSILVNDREVGYIKISENYLTQIEIFDDEKRKERNNGYGTEAIKQLLKLKESDGYDCLKTNTIVNPIFQEILEDIGFDKTDDSMSNKYKYTF